MAGSFYHLVSYALELRPEGLLHLITAENSVESLSNLGRLLRHGVFNLADNTVNISALEALTYLAQFCATRVTNTSLSNGSSASEAAAALAMVTHLPLGKDLLWELLSLVTREVFPTQLESSLSACVFSLAALDLVSENVFQFF